MKKQKLLGHIPLLFLIYLVLFQTAGARWVANNIPIPGFSQMVAVAYYLPFAVFAAWLLICDMQRLRQKKLSLFSLLYYAFAVYFVGLSAYRLATGGEIMDGLYYVIVLYGSLAVAELIRRGHIPTTKASLQFDISLFAVILCLYRLAYCLLEKHVDYNIMPINEIAMGAVLLFSLGVAANGLRNPTGKMQQLLAALAIVGIVVVILTLTSRVMLVGLCIAALWLLILFALDKASRKYLKSLIGLFLCAGVLVFTLAALDVGNVRYALYRATGLSQSTSFWGWNPSAPPSSSPETPSDPSASIPPAYGDASQNQAANQIVRSDALRTRLMNFGLDEAKKNLLFGTGNVYLEIDDFGYVSRVPVHNGILQMLVAFGLIGMLLVISMAAVWFWQSRPLPLSIQNSNITSLLLLIGLFCMLGMVQATCFDLLVLPAALLCACESINPEKSSS